ncbi:sensor histidine kinase [Streptomyces sp. bgisy159]|uniref:sensor histidine kinase n=1 Tax=Streptomyces sp. bgisy159 TaxID=3413795 RepID=UPI003F4A7B0A
MTPTDALRAQQHECADRMRTPAVLLDVGEPDSAYEYAYAYDSAYEYAIDTARSGPALTDEVRRRTGHRPMAGLIAAKSTVAAERGVRIDLTGGPSLGDDPPHRLRLLTVVGHLLDNGIGTRAEAPSPRGGRRVRLTVAENDRRITVRAADNGPGVPPGTAGSIFEDGWSPRPGRGAARRGPAWPGCTGWCGGTAAPSPSRRGRARSSRPYGRCRTPRPPRGAHCSRRHCPGR